jgi:hypothetical protein
MCDAQRGRQSSQAFVNRHTLVYLDNAASDTHSFPCYDSRLVTTYTSDCAPPPSLAPLGFLPEAASPLCRSPSSLQHLQKSTRSSALRVMSVSPVSDADVARSGVTTSRTRSPTCLPPYHFSPSSQPHLSSSSQQSNLPLQLISNALSLGPTLLPPQLAQLITALSLATKVSLRATALFIELIIESCRYSTSVGLGLSRRALISAVGSARTFYVVREGLDWAGGKAADSLMR